MKNGAGFSATADSIPFCVGFGAGWNSGNGQGPVVVECSNTGHT